MTDISKIGINSILAFKYALTVSSQNLANADTPYYSRRTVDFTANPLNQGVSANDVRRISDEVLNQYDNAATSQCAALNSYVAQLHGFQPVFEKSDASISVGLTNSLSTLEKLNTDPSSIPSRNLYLGQLGNVVTRFQQVTSSISQARSANTQQIQTDVSQINDVIQSLSQVNTKLLQGENHNNPDLLDQRDGLLQDLAKYINFTSQIDNASGAASVALENGLYILYNDQATPLITQTDPANPLNVQVAIDNGGHISSIMNQLASGQLMGRLQFQNTVLDGAQRAVDRLAMGIAQAMNSQNNLGMDFNGNLGTNLFSDINTPSATLGRVIPNMNNTGHGNLGVSVTNLPELTTSDYQLTIGASQSYTVMRTSDNTVVSSGTVTSTFPQTISADGFSINLASGSFNAGDCYTISPTAGGVNNFTLLTQDPTKLALAWPVMGTVGTQAPGSTGAIQLTGMTSTATSAFSTPKNLTPPIQITFLSPTSYQVVNATTQQVMEGPLTYNPSTGTALFPTAGGYDPGYRVQLSGYMQAGDTFNIAYNTNTTDNKNGQAFATLYQTGLFEQGGLSWGQDYEKIASSVAMETNAAQSALKSAEILKKQADARRDDVSGVSVEEETMNLTNYQECYQASAQILATAKAVFDTIIEMTRRL